MGCLHTETQSLHPILPIQSCKWWVRYNIQTLFLLYTLLQINYGWEYQWHIITILFLVFELCFQSKTNYLIQFFYMVFPHNDYPCFLIFNSNPTHIQEVFFFLSFPTTALKTDFSIRCNWICWKGKELNCADQSMIQLCLSHQN